MKFLGIAILVALGWNLGEFIWKIFFNFIYKLVPDKYKKSKKVRYTSHYER